MVCTPRHKKSSSKIAVAIVIVCVVLVAVVGWHDGLFGTTSIADINNGDVPDGTQVTIKGRLTLRLGNIHTVSALDGDPWVVFEWTGTSPPIDSIVVVRGVVATVASLEGVTSLEVVWLLR